MNDSEIILDNLLLNLRSMPSHERTDRHASEILWKAEEVSTMAQIRTYSRLKKCFGWTEKNLKAILNELRSKWHPKGQIVDTGEHHQQLDFDNFPHKEVSNSKISLLDTVANTEHLLKEYGITANQDQIKKKDILFVPGDDGTEYADFIETIIGLVRLNGLPQVNTVNRVASIAHKNPINSVTKHLKNLGYQGSEHIQRLADHITVEPGTEHVRDKVFKMWMIMACAAADYAESTPNKKAIAKFDSVMIFVGNQGIKKTQFFKAMLPEPLRQYLNDGVMIDPTDKDSVAECLQWWVVEAGEIETIFRKVDISRFKAFLSRSVDVFRKPYERSAREYQRRTAFVGSANEREFLKDYTGNRRYWPLWVKELTIPTDDSLLDNAWAEAWENYVSGEIWWAEPDFEETLLNQVRSFQVPISNEPIEESIRDLIKLGKGVFACDVLRPINIRDALQTDYLSKNYIKKVPTINMISRIMRQQGLGVAVKTSTGSFWIIRNIGKYEEMKPADVERYHREFQNNS